MVVIEETGVTLMGDRDKECKKLTSRAIKGLMFSGVDTDRKDFIRFTRRLNDIFELSYEEDFSKSGGGTITILQHLLKRGYGNFLLLN